MEKENDKIDEDFGEIQESEDTDWKTETFKLREKAIRQREKTKDLRNTLKEQEEKITNLEKSVSKPKEESKSDEFGLLQKTYLRSAGIVEEDEVELAKNIQKKTGLDWDKLVEDDYFKTKLDSLRVEKSNINATSSIQGSSGNSQIKNDPEYWLAKGVPPTSEQISDRKTRAKIARAFIEQAKTGKKFYNE